MCSHLVNRPLLMLNIIRVMMIELVLCMDAEVSSAAEAIRQ